MFAPCPCSENSHTRNAVNNIAVQHTEKIFANKTEKSPCIKKCKPPMPFHANSPCRHSENPPCQSSMLPFGKFPQHKPETCCMITKHCKQCLCCCLENCPCRHLENSHTENPATCSIRKVYHGKLQLEKSNIVNNVLMLLHAHASTYAHTRNIVNNAVGKSTQQTQVTQA